MHSPVFKRKSHDDGKNASEIRGEVTNLQEKELALKNDMIQYLHQLEPLILNSDQNIALAILEEYCALAVDLG